MTRYGSKADEEFKNDKVQSEYTTDSEILLLVEGVYLLSKSSITRHDINNADLCFQKFVRNFEALYGKANVTYNVHQFTHLAQTVIDWGSLWCYSSYIFEGFNMILLRLFHGTQAAPHQIANFFLLYRAMTGLCNSSTEDPHTSLVLSFMTEQLKGHAQLKTNVNVTVLHCANYKRKSRSRKLKML